jgi:phage anti-repressor protein
MRSSKSNQSTTVKNSGLIASSSRHELPLTQQGDNFLLDARLLHQKLKSGHQFADWIKKRIEQFGFEPDKDFFSNVRKSTGGRPSIDVYITLDMAKELAMIENNEEGRFWRRYFIQKEKEARGISHLPKEAGLFKGLKYKRFNNRLMYPYKEFLEAIGSNPHSNGSRKARYWMHFIKDDHKLYVTEEFALHIYRQKQVLVNRSVMLASQPVLPLNFGDVKQLKHA